MSSPPNASCEGRKVPTTGPLGHWALSALQWRPRCQQAAHLLRPFFDRWPYSDHYFIILFNYSCLQLIHGSLLWICYYYYNFLSIIFHIWFWIFFTYGIPSHEFLAPPLPRESIEPSDPIERVWAPPSEPSQALYAPWFWPYPDYYTFLDYSCDTSGVYYNRI